MRKPEDPKAVLQSFNYKGVQLLDGHLKDQFRQVRDYYYAIPNDCILKGFRARAGLPAPGKELGGWYSMDKYHTFGQWLSAFARMYKATGDIAIRDKAVYLLEEWAKTITDDGFFYYSNKPNAPHYIYEKMVGGLVDMYEYFESERALQHLERITDWAENNLDRMNLYANGGVGHRFTEWYTLSENLYRAYELTGKERYRNFAKIWEYTDFWGLFARGEDIFSALKNFQFKHYHAYSHVNSLSGAAMAYRVTGESNHLKAIVNAYNYLQNIQCFATGGYGPEERLIVPDGLAETLKQQVMLIGHFETMCGSWAAFKLTRYLMMFTGEAHYGDWVERLIYNGVGAAIPMNKFGEVMYGSYYSLLGAWKTLHSRTAWSCCTGTFPIAVADYHNLIYFYDKENLYVNLFVPSKVEWNGPDGMVTVVQETRFPEHDTVLLRVEPKAPSWFGLKFRVPKWAGNNIKVKVNHAPFKVETVPGKWATIERNWSPGNVVKLQFDLSPRIEPLVGSVSPVALLCGPVVMAATTGLWGIPANVDLKNPAAWLRRPTERLEYFVLMQSRNQVFSPYYYIKAGEPYRMYFERPGEISISPDELVFHNAGTGGSWYSDGTIRYAQAPGSYFEGRFKGTTVVWEGLRCDDGGIAQVSIDGQEVAEVDQYGYTGVTDQYEVPFKWSISNLDKSEHTIKVTISPHKNPASHSTNLNVRRLVVYP